MSLHEDLKAYADGELDPLRSEEMRLALEREPGLRRELSEIKALASSLQTHAVQHTPVGFEKTLQAIQAGERLNSGFNLIVLWRGAALAAACVAVLVIGYPVFLGQAHVRAKYSTGAARQTKRSVVLLDQNKSANGMPWNTAASPSQAKASVVRRAKPAARLRMSSSTAVGANPSTAPPTISPSATRGIRTKGAFGKSPEVKFINGDAFGSAPQPQPTGGTGTAGATGTIDARVHLSAPVGGRLGSVPSAAGPEVVVLTFHSRESGMKNVLSAVRKYQLSDGRLQAGSRGASADKDGTIVLDLPEDTADATIASLRKLSAADPRDASGMRVTASLSAAANKPTITRTVTAASNGASSGLSPTGGFGGGGGVGGGGGGAFAGGQPGGGRMATRPLAPPPSASATKTPSAPQSQNRVMMKMLNTSAKKSGSAVTVGGKAVDGVPLVPDFARRTATKQELTKMPKTRRVIIVIVEPKNPKPVP